MAKKPVDPRQAARDEVAARIQRNILDPALAGARDIHGKKVSVRRNREDKERSNYEVVAFEITAPRINPVARIFQFLLGPRVLGHVSFYLAKSEGSYMDGGNIQIRGITADKEDMYGDSVFSWWTPWDSNGQKTAVLTDEGYKDVLIGKLGEASTKSKLELK